MYFCIRCFVLVCVVDGSVKTLLVFARVSRRAPLYLKKSRYRNPQRFTMRRVCIVMHSAVCHVARCLSVRLSHAGILFKWLHISSNFFSPSGSPTILVFPYQTRWQYFDGDPLTGHRMQEGMKKSQFLTNISLYLGNDAT